MAINKIAAPLSTSPSVFAEPVVNQLLALVIGIEKQEDRIVSGYVKKGSIFNIHGDLFIADSDTLVSGTELGSVAVKLTVSGNTASPEYVTVLTDVSFSNVYNGLYDTDGNLYVTDYIYPGDRYYLPKLTNCGMKISKTNYVELVNMIIPRSGLWRIKWDMTPVYQPNKYHHWFSRLYRNGDGVMPEHHSSTDSNNAPTTTNCQDEYYFDKGDVCSIYVHGYYYTSYTESYDTYIQNGVIITEFGICNANIGIKI